MVINLAPLLPEMYEYIGFLLSLTFDVKIFFFIAPLVYNIYYTLEMQYIIYYIKMYNAAQQLTENLTTVALIPIQE